MKTDLIFEVLTAVRMSVVIVYFETQCGLVGFGRTLKMEAINSTETLVTA